MAASDQMLREIKNVKQEPGAGFRRWFESDGFDLIVWFSLEGAATGFQICYNLGEGEHALTWRSGAGFSHGRIDAGDASPFRDESPIVVANGAVPWADVRAKYAACSLQLDPAIQALVAARLAAQR